MARRGHHGNSAADSGQLRDMSRNAPNRDTAIGQVNYWLCEEPNIQPYSWVRGNGSRRELPSHFWWLLSQLVMSYPVLPVL